MARYFLGDRAAPPCPPMSRILCFPCHPMWSECRSKSGRLGRPKSRRLPRQTVEDSWFSGESKYTFEKVDSKIQAFHRIPDPRKPAAGFSMLEPCSYGEGPCIVCLPFPLLNGGAASLGCYVPCHSSWSSSMGLQPLLALWGGLGFSGCNPTQGASPQTPLVLPILESQLLFEPKPVAMLDALWTPCERSPMKCSMNGCSYRFAHGFTHSARRAWWQQSKKCPSPSLLYHQGDFRNPTRVQLDEWPW